MKEFEHIALNTLINEKEYFNKIVGLLEPKHMTDIGNQYILKIIKQYYTEYSKIPSITDLIGSVKNVENIEIRKVIKDALIDVNAVKPTDNVEFMINETVDYIKDSMYLDALRIGSEGLMKKDQELKQKAQQILDERAKINVDSDLGIDFDDIEAMIEYYSEQNIGILTQHKSFNKRLGSGFLPGTLSLILSPSGVGKSLLMTDFCSGWIEDGKNVLLVSLEMADREIMKRVHANVMNLPINSLIDLSKTPAELAKIKVEDPLHEFVSKDDIMGAYNKLKLSGKCGKLKIKDYPSGSFSPLQLEALVSSFEMEQDIKFDMILVDYMGIMKSDLLTPNAGLYSYIKSIAEELRATAKKLKVPILSASQLNRGAVGDTQSADNSAVSDSMGSVMTADLLVFLLQDDEMKAKNEMVAKCTKNRFTGMTDTWMMNIDYTRMKFSDMVPVSDSEAYLQVSDNSADGDFGIITAPKMERATEFANAEVKEIQANAHANRDVPFNELSKPQGSDDIMDMLNGMMS